MKNKSKQEIAKVLSNTKIIPVFYNADIEICKTVISACYKGGLRVFEYTNRGEEAIKNFPLLLEFIKSEFPDMLLGIGSIVSKEQAKQFIDINADFIVAPILDRETALYCMEKEMFWVPGCATLSEIGRAEKLGAEIIKLFPGSVLGPEFVKAVKGPMPWLKLMPTGGVEPTKESLKEWFDAGVVCVGIGSKLIAPEMFDKPEKLTQKIKDVVSIIENDI